MRFTKLKEYPDYGVTRTGKVYSHKSGKWKPLKPQKDTDGYEQVRLSKNGKSRLTFVHRLVADTFIPKQEGYNEVNHIDGNKLNNRADNLEWCTRRENVLHAHNTGLIKTRTPIVATNLKTGEKTIFKGQHEAARQLNLNQGNINHALRNKNRNAYGYHFEYAKEVD